MILAGDIGGTKTQIAAYDPSQGYRRPLYSQIYPSRDYGSLASIVNDFIQQHDLSVRRATFGVAGPVIAGQSKITNLDWYLEERELSRQLAIPKLRLINDLAAVAYSVPQLHDDELEVLQAGSPSQSGNKAIVAPGTGLGQSFLVWDRDRYHAFPSEGGHASFSPATALQVGLLRYLQERFGHVSVERVASGSGFLNLYNYLLSVGFATEPAWLKLALERAQDPTPVLLKGAIGTDRPCDLCRAALDLFIEILAAEAGNFALKILPGGGLYLGGGMPLRILPALRSPNFKESFIDKGRLRDYLETVPVSVILHPDAALMGAAVHAFRAHISGVPS
jgi:glucokinase